LPTSFYRDQTSPQGTEGRSLCTHRADRGISRSSNRTAKGPLTKTLSRCRTDYRAQRANREVHCVAYVPISSGEEKVRSPVGLCLNLPFAMDADCACGDGGGGKACSSCFGAWGWSPLGSRHEGFRLALLAWLASGRELGTEPTRKPPPQPDRRGRYESPLGSGRSRVRQVALTARKLLFRFTGNLDSGVQIKCLTNLFHKNIYAPPNS